MSDAEGWHARLDLQPSYPSPAVKAALLVLLSAGGGPLSYQHITTAAIERGLWRGPGDTPVNTLARDLRRDVERAHTSGLTPLFAISSGPPAQVSLVLGAGRATVVEDAFARVRAVLGFIQELHPRAFEQSVAELLWRMGYRDVAVTRYTSDDGVDITASFPCGPICDQRFVFQVKRWQRPVGASVVRYLRGALDDNEQGVLVATGGFYPAARQLAEQWRRPIQLVDGKRLTQLAVEHGMVDEPAASPCAPRSRLRVAA